MNSNVAQLSVNFQMIQLLCLQIAVVKVYRLTVYMSVCIMLIFRIWIAFTAFAE